MNFKSDLIFFIFLLFLLSSNICELQLGDLFHFTLYFSFCLFFCHVLCFCQLLHCIIDILHSVPSQCVFLYANILVSNICLFPLTYNFMYIIQLVLITSCFIVSSSENFALYLSHLLLSLVRNKFNK